MKPFESMTKYLCIGASYGFIRKCINTFQDPKILVSQEYDADKHKMIANTRSMLVSEKLSTIIAHTAFSTLYWPYFVTKDIVLTEAKLRKIELKEDNPFDMDLYWHITN